MILCLESMHESAALTEINFKDNELVNMTRAWEACGKHVKS